MTPVYSQQYATFVKAVHLPHIYDPDWVRAHGFNGRPATARLLIREDLKLHGRREGARTTDDTDPARMRRIYTEVHVYRVEIRMPNGSMRSVEFGITEEPEMLEKVRP